MSVVLLSVKAKRKLASKPDAVVVQYTYGRLIGRTFDGFVYIYIYYELL